MVSPQQIRIVRCSQIARTILRNFDRTNEPVPDRGDGLDVARAANVVAQQTAQKPDAACQGALGNCGIAPDGVEQLFLRDQPLRVVQQKQEGSKGLRLNRQHFARFGQRELPLANLDIVESENKGLNLHNKSIIRQNNLLSHAKKLITSP